MEITMNNLMVTKKRRQLKLGFAAFGLLLAIGFASYFGANPNPDSPAALLGRKRLALCLPRLPSIRYVH
jgi:hypothetical protein